MNTEILSCAKHDYIEIACLYGYPLKLELTDGTTVQGQAVTTQTSDNKEYLLLNRAGKTRQIELLRIKTLQALTPNPHFDRIRF